MNKHIHVPGYIYKGITRNIRGSQPLNVMAGDTETCQGIPYLIQLCRDGQWPDLYDVDAETVLPVFLEWLKENTMSRRTNPVNILYFHNLPFDLGAILCRYRDERWLRNEFTITGDDYIIDVKNGKCCFAEIRFYDKGVDEDKRETTRVLVVDSFAFYRAGLGRVADILQLEHRKYESPFTDADKRYTRREIERYAVQDVLVELDLAKNIAGWCSEYDVKPCVSLPQLAMRIFKHCFLEEGDVLPYPAGFDKGCIKSYHGGRNGYYVEGEPPVKIEGVSELDVVSMYPWAMTQIPNFLHCEYEQTDKIEKRRDGVYYLEANIRPGKYPALFDHDFHPAAGYYRGLWTTSYELRRAVKEKQIDITELKGVVVRATRKRNPLKDYVDHFFEKKRECGHGDPRRLFYKTAMNACYGKFIQNVDHTCGRRFSWNGHTFREIAHNFEAGGLFNPLIATLITGCARARLHELECRYQALESSTDAIKTLKHARASDLGDGLGKLEYKFKDYRVYFFRSKLYLALGETVEGATHGCMAGSGDKSPNARKAALLKMMLNDEWEYEYVRMTKMRESIRQEALNALTMQKRRAELNLGRDMRGWRDLLKRKDGLIDDAFIDSSLTSGEQRQKTFRGVCR